MNLLDPYSWDWLNKHPQAASPHQEPPLSNWEGISSLQIGAGQRNIQKKKVSWWYCWWKKSGDHRLRLVVYPITCRVLYIPGGAVCICLSPQCHCCGIYHHLILWHLGKTRQIVCPYAPSTPKHHPPKSEAKLWRWASSQFFVRSADWSHIRTNSGK